jgi:hypothetical protein
MWYGSSAIATTVPELLACTGALIYPSAAAIICPL